MKSLTFTALGGIAGALYAPLVGLVSSRQPSRFTLSLNLLMMVIVGGSGYFFGPFLGAMVAVLLPEWLRFLDSLLSHSLFAPGDGAPDLIRRPA